MLATLIKSLSNLDVATLSFREMVALAITKKARRLTKGLSFNCLVIDCEKKAPYSCVDFLNTIQSLPNTTSGRAQVIFKNGIHWSTADIQIKNGQIASVFFIDAAGLLGHIQPFAAAVQQIETAKVYYSGGGIQVDGVNCGGLAFDHACCLSKIGDLHEQLASIHSKRQPFQNLLEALKQAQLSEPVKNQIDFSPFDSIQFVAFTDFPSTFGPLLRNMQFTQSLHSLMKTKNNFFGNSKTETLPQYFLNRSRGKKTDVLLEQCWPEVLTLTTSYTHPDSFTHNVLIERKVISIKTKAVTYLQSFPDGSNLHNAIVFDGTKIVWPLSDDSIYAPFSAFWAILQRSQKKIKSEAKSEETKPLLKKKSEDSCCPINCTIS